MLLRTSDGVRHMNRNLTFIRLYYLFWLGAGGFIYPFISLFYKQQGLSGTQMGLLGTIGSIIGLISAPLIGQISDNRVQSAASPADMPCRLGCPFSDSESTKYVFMDRGDRSS